MNRELELVVFCILMPLLEKGLKVDGFDTSEEILKRCRNNCEKRGLNPKLFEGKMTFKLFQGLLNNIEN